MSFVQRIAEYVKSKSDFEKALIILVFCSTFLYPFINIILIYLGFVQVPRFNDFSAYYYAAERFLTDESIYSTLYIFLTDPSNYPSSQYGQPFVYPPIISIFFVPFTYLDFRAAGYVWGLVCVALLIISVKMLFKSEAVVLEKKLEVILYVCAIGFSPVITTLKAGQISICIFFLLTLSWYMYRRGNKTFSGIFMLFAATPKPCYILAAGYFLQKRSFRALLGMIVGLAGIIVISILLFSQSELVTYIKDIVLLKSNEAALNVGSPLPIEDAGCIELIPLYHFDSISLFVRIGVFLMLGGLLLFNPKDSIYTKYLFSLSIVTVILIFPIIDTDDLVMLLIPFFLVGISEYRMRNNLTIPLISLFLVQIHPYSVEFIAKFGPCHFPAMFVQISWIYDILPYIQPGMYGVWMLFGFILYRMIFGMLYHHKLQEKEI
jgi:hypothetical protein